MSLRIQAVLLCFGALFLGLYLQLFGFNLPVVQTVKEPKISNFFWPEQKTLSEFEMVSHQNKPFKLSDMSGQWNLLFFGYTHCPDICPITMSTMKQTQQHLEQNKSAISNQIKYVFISVDGERDTPAHLNQYIGYFGDSFTGATGNKSQVDSLATQLGIPYAIAPHEPGESYLVSHTGSLFLISPEGKLASIFQMPFTAEEISERLQNIHSFMEKQS